MNGFWNELAHFIRGLLNAAFKTNAFVERALLTGITRVSKESIFSDLNNLAVITTTSEPYADSFGFTEREVFDALEEYGLSEQKQEVKAWYDGFTFGSCREIYNPWSITSFLREKELGAYWANTSSNALVEKLIRTGSADIKISMEDLLGGRPIETRIDEEIVFDQLDYNATAIWSLLLASGYLKVDQKTMRQGVRFYRLSLTNFEVWLMFQTMVDGWFRESRRRESGTMDSPLRGSRC